MTHAKQNENEIIPVTQVFYFPSQKEAIESRENIKLLDLDEDLITKIEDGERYDKVK